jgi:uncharacterized protein (TIGR02466 family)
MNNHTLIDPFSTPFFIVDVDKTDYNIISKEIEKSLIDLKNKNSFKQRNSKHYEPDINIAKISGDSGERCCNIIEEYNLIHLKNKILRYANEYFYSIHKKTLRDSMLNVELSSSWITLSNQNNYGPVHNHNDLNVSGAYYHKVFQNCGNINFRSTNKCPEISHFYQGIAYYSIEPKNGRLIMFPSWIDHYVTSNQTTKERISLSFNIKCQRSTFSPIYTKL